MATIEQIADLIRRESYLDIDGDIHEGRASYWTAANAVYSDDADEMIAGAVDKAHAATVRAKILALEPAAIVQLEVVDEWVTLTVSIAPDTFESLCQLYYNWQREQGLELGSADDVDQDTLKPEQAVWIREFISRWDAMTLAAREDRRRFRTSEGEANAVPFTLAEMIRANHEDHDVCERMRMMRPGQRIATGGGAAGPGWVECFAEQS